MTRTYTETVTLQEVTCPSCSILYAVPQHWLQVKGNMHAGFYCPNGHSLTYGETDAVRLRKELQTVEQRAKQLEIQLTSTQDQLQATKRELQRHKKRVANGVCPCCNRSFVQLQRHMKTKHPEYAS